MMDKELVKVVYNDCFGGFGLSQKACNRLRELGVDPGYKGTDLPRHLPELVAVVEELGSKAASGGCAKLAIRTLSGRMYRIDEYDGAESVIEPGRTVEWIHVP